ncbi:MAG: hypothetical protein NBV67_15200 [Tagaea sp.]|nr:hypothetical protein [Tagaea sp.]
MSGPRAAFAVFAAALAMRLVYLAAVYDGPASFAHVDSNMWLDLARDAAIWPGSHERLPLYPLFLRAHLAAFGDAGPLAAVVSQMAIDAAACVAILRLAEAIRPGAGVWAGFLAAINPTQIVMAGVLLGDSLYMAQLAFGFLALARWWRAGAPSEARHGLAIGLWFGSALLNRAMMWPFLPVLGLASFALALVHRARPAQAWRVPATVLGIVALCAAPQIARNWIAHGQASLSSQGGQHLALWVYPLAKEAADGTPYWRSFERVRAEYAARGGTFDGARPFAESALFGQLGREGMAEIGVGGMAKAWAMGAAINLASPATLMIPRVMALPRTGFYATEGDTPLAKAVNFVTRSSSSTYIAWLAGGVALEWPVRALAVAGLALALFAAPARAAALFAGLWAGYVLAVLGPIASAKYRLPIEPFAMAFAGYALAAWRARKARPA